MLPDGPPGVLPEVEVTYLLPLESRRVAIVALAVRSSVEEAVP